MWLLVPFPSLKRTKGKSRNKTSESPFVPKQRLSKDQGKQCFAFILSLACSLNNRILFYITIKLSSENRPGTPFRSSVPRPVHSNRFRPVQASWISLLCFILNGLKLWNVLLSWIVFRSRIYSILFPQSSFRTADLILDPSLAFRPWVLVRNALCLSAPASSYITWLRRSLKCKHSWFLTADM